MSKSTTSEAGSSINSTNEQTEYDLPVELFAGSVVIIMGVLVLLTPLITTIPQDYVWNPALMDLVSGAIYIIIGVYLLIRSRQS